MKIFDRLYMIGSMSLGDAFAINGLVHYFGDITHELHISMPSEFIETIKTLYQDYQHIKVAAIDSYDGENAYIQQNKLSKINKPIINRYLVEGVDIPIWWDVQYYDFYNVPYSIRYSHCRIPEHIDGAEELYNNLVDDEPYILVHRYSYRYPNGFNINIPHLRHTLGLPSDYKIIEIKEGLTNNMMHFIKLIENAQEIHCVASSVFNLVDSMHKKIKAKLFFHDVRKNSLMRVNSKWNDYRWTWIYYPNEARI